MKTRAIRVREDVFEQLKARKRPDVSFSDLLARLSDRETGFESGFGAMEPVDSEGALVELDVEHYRQ